jgi:hypothetical protein
LQYTVRRNSSFVPAALSVFYFNPFTGPSEIALHDRVDQNMPEEQARCGTGCRGKPCAHLLGALRGSLQAALYKEGGPRLLHLLEDTRLLYHLLGYHHLYLATLDHT